MPVRIPPHWLDCCFYVYRTVEDAKQGSNSGGSGCIIAIPSTYAGWIHVYAVTNRHLIDKGFGVLRLNTHDGKTSTVETQWEDWEILEESGDVTVKPLDLAREFRYKPIFLEEFMSRETMEDFQLLPGEEVFLIGRLVHQSGQQRNTPVVRFGNLSMRAYPDEPVDMGEYGKHEAFLVECRSVSGFSGSPVFLTSDRTIFAKDGRLPEDRKYAGSYVIEVRKHEEQEVQRTAEDGVAIAKIVPISMTGTFGPWFIGIDRGHVPLWKPVREIDIDTGIIDEQTESKYRAEQNTGIACVIPAWKIIDVLNKEVLVKQRKRDDAEIPKKMQNATVDDVDS